MKKTVVLGITSGIAAYKSAELVTLLKKEGIDVFVVMTTSAEKMVDIKEFEKRSGNKIYSELFEKDFNYKQVLQKRKVDHIDLADRADVVCIAPATANTIAKIAHGIADDFLTTLVLASNSPIILAPSMNVHMWNNPVTQQNIEILKKRGFIIIPPEHGQLACGYEGPGRLPHIVKIKAEIDRHIAYSKSLVGKTVVVTAGGTKEYIDDVRFITNNSSGKMGVALADECYLRGAKVILLKAKNAVSPRYLYQIDEFETGRELEKLLRKYLKNADIVFHSAAVGDFIPQQYRGKLSSRKHLEISFSPQKKISDEIKKINKNIFLVVFKAEWNLSEKELVKKAKEKLKESNANVVVANDASQKDRGFQSDTNEIIFVTEKKNISIPLQTKQLIAKNIIDLLLVEFPQ